MRKFILKFLGISAILVAVMGADYDSGIQLNDLIQFKNADEGAVEIFAGSPDIFSSDWDNSDFESYRKIVGTAAADKGGLVFEFVIPKKAKTLAEIECTGKVGAVAAGNQINYRVKDEAAVEVATGTITAATETDLTITSFSPSPGLTAGDRIIVEAEGVVDNTEEVFVGSCRATFTR